MARMFGYFLLLVLVLMIVTVAIRNPATTVDVDLYFGKFIDVPLVQALFVAFLLGSLMTFLSLVGNTIRLKFSIRKLTGRIREYEQELTAIRNIPVEESARREEESSPAVAGPE